MAPVIPNPKKIKAFRSEVAFEAWLRAHDAGETEIWLRIYKKGAGKPTVTYAQALDVALCWGWIDGIRKGFDDESFLQRYTPRRATPKNSSCGTRSRTKPLARPPASRYSFAERLGRVPQELRRAARIHG